MSPAFLSALWVTKGAAHFNRGELRFAVEAFRNSKDLIDRSEFDQVVAVGGADHRIVTHLYLARSLLLMGRFDEAALVIEGYVEPINRFDKPFEMAWVLIMKCYLYSIIGQDELLLACAEKMIEISKRHGHQARLANGLLFRGEARSRLGDLDAGVIDAQEGARLWPGR